MDFQTSVTYAATTLVFEIRQAQKLRLVHQDHILSLTNSRYFCFYIIKSYKKFTLNSTLNGTFSVTSSYLVKLKPILSETGPN